MPLLRPALYWFLSCPPVCPSLCSVLPSPCSTHRAPSLWMLPPVFSSSTSQTCPNPVAKAFCNLAAPRLLPFLARLSGALPAPSPSSTLQVPRLPPEILLSQLDSSFWPPPAAGMKDIREVRALALPGVPPPLTSYVLPRCRRRSPALRSAVRRRRRRRRLGGETTKGGGSPWAEEGCPCPESLSSPSGTHG